MIIICEECGKRYRIDPEKIKGDAARFKCKTCGNMVTIEKPPAVLKRTPPFQLPAEPEQEPPPSAPAERETAEGERPVAAIARLEQRARRGMGLRKKMMLLFFFIPMFLVAAAGLLCLWQLDRLSTSLTDESSRLATHTAEERIAEIAKSVILTRNITFTIFGATLLLIGLIVSIYGHLLTRRIKTLTEVADRISVGELDTEVDIKANDEIGDLAQALTRMQDSIRLSIERLRRRR